MTVKDHDFPARLGAVAVGSEIYERRFDHHGGEAVGRQPFVAAAIPRAKKGCDRCRSFCGPRRLDLPIENELPRLAQTAPRSESTIHIARMRVAVLQGFHGPHALHAIEIAGEGVLRWIGVRGRAQRQDYRDQIRTSVRSTVFLPFEALV